MVSRIISNRTRPPAGGPETGPGPAFDPEEAAGVRSLKPPGAVGEKPRFGRRLRAQRGLPLLTIWLLVWLVVPGSPALAATTLLEDLHYQLAVMAWRDAAWVRLTLNRLGPGHFVAKAIGEPKGLIKFLTGERRERLETEMVWRNHRFLPLVYREESLRHGKYRLNEYHFDYSQRRLEMWQGDDGRGLVKKWETDLLEPVYDPLTAFYNCRLGIMGPTRPGETGTIPGIPYPQPETMEVRLGEKTEAGCEAMISLVNPVFEDSRGVVFAYLDDRLVPRRARTTIFGITIRGILLPESIIMPPGLPELTAPGPVTTCRPPGASRTATALEGDRR